MHGLAASLFHCSHVIPFLWTTHTICNTLQPLRDMRIICESYMECHHSECPNRPNLLVFVVYHVSYNSGRSKCASGAWSSHCGTIGKWCSPEASGAISTDHKWGFPKIGVPLVIIHLNGNFRELNHPAMGAPPFSDTS